MENLKLSIIIPVYNVEKYLAKCLDSVLVGNAFTGQIICVNDGSTDNSLTILEQYAKQYPNVEIITQPNAGLSAARNAGISAARGEYVCFLDSDDYWEPNALNGLLEQIERDNLDVLRFKYQNVNEKYEIYLPYKRDNRLDNDYSEEPTDGVSFLNERMNMQCYAVMFIVKRDLIYSNQSSVVSDQYLGETNILFTPGIYFEDTDWTPRMLVKAKRVASTETVVYNYLMREGSITNAVNRSKQKKVLDDKMHLIATLQKQAMDLRKSGRYNRWYADMISDTVVSVIGMLSISFYTEKGPYLARLKEMEIYPIASRSLKARLINISPRFAVELLHLKNH